MDEEIINKDEELQSEEEIVEESEDEEEESEEETQEESLGEPEPQMKGSKVNLKAPGEPSKNQESEGLSIKPVKLKAPEPWKLGNK